MKTSNCPSCGASLAYHAGFGETVARSYCRAVVGLEGERRTVVHKQEEIDRRELLIPLGTKGVIRGSEHQAIGFMARSDDEGAEWEEYRFAENLRGVFRQTSPKQFQPFDFQYPVGIHASTFRMRMEKPNPIRYGRF